MPFLDSELKSHRPATSFAPCCNQGEDNFVSPLELLGMLKGLAVLACRSFFGLRASSTLPCIHAPFCSTLLRSHQGEDDTMSLLELLETPKGLAAVMCDAVALVAMVPFLYMEVGVGLGPGWYRVYNRRRMDARAQHV